MNIDCLFYFINLEGGDFTIGRLAALLGETERFALLPPRWKPDSAIDWSEYLDCWCCIPASFRSCVHNIMASVVFAITSKDFLSHFKSDRPYFRSKFYLNDAVTKLQSILLPPEVYHCPICKITANGIPTQILNYIKLTDVKKDLENQTRVMNEVLKGQLELRGEFRLMLEKLDNLALNPTASSPSMASPAPATQALAQMLTGMHFRVCTTYPFDL